MASVVREFIEVPVARDQPVFSIDIRWCSGGPQELRMLAELSHDSITCPNCRLGKPRGFVLCSPCWNRLPAALQCGLHPSARNFTQQLRRALEQLAGE